MVGGRIPYADSQAVLLCQNTDSGSMLMLGRQMTKHLTPTT